MPTDQADAELDALSQPRKARPLRVGDHKLSYSDTEAAVDDARSGKDGWGRLNTGLIGMPIS
jgi:hypothetical protein